MPEGQEISIDSIHISVGNFTEPDYSKYITTEISDCKIERHEIARFEKVMVKIPKNLNHSVSNFVNNSGEKIHLDFLQWGVPTASGVINCFLYEAEEDCRGRQICGTVVVYEKTITREDGTRTFRYLDIVKVEAGIERQLKLHLNWKGETPPSGEACIEIGPGNYACVVPIKNWNYIKV